MADPTRKIERVYLDSSAAHERALTWRRLGIVSILVEPWTGWLGQRVYILTGQATDEQIANL